MNYHFLQKRFDFLRIYSEFSSKFGAEKKNLVSLNFDIDLNISLTSFIFFLDIVLDELIQEYFFYRNLSEVFFRRSNLIIFSFFILSLHKAPFIYTFLIFSVVLIFFIKLG